MIKLTDPKVANKIFWGLVAVCALLVVVDVVVTLMHLKHGHFPEMGEDIPGIYGVFGFIVFWIIVIAGKHFRKFVKRKEDYYDK